MKKPLLLKMFLLIILTSCAPIDDYVGANYRESLGFSTTELMANRGNFKVDYFPRLADESGRRQAEDGGLAVIQAVCEGASTCNFRFAPPHYANRPDHTAVTVIDKAGRTTHTIEANCGDVVLVTDHSTQPVFLTRNWSPPKGASESVVLRDLRAMVSRYYSEKSTTE